jgi:phosphohistidine phosphatase SixA
VKTQLRCRGGILRILPLALAAFLAAACIPPGPEPPAGRPGDGVTTVVIVRHAEKDTAGIDPHLTPAGKERARRLARMLADEPVRMLMSSDRARTRETLEPLSALTGLMVTAVPVGGGAGKHARDLADSIRAHPGGTVVVSNHSDVIPTLLRELGVEEEIRIPDNEYERIFIVILGPGETVTFFRMRFGT